MFKNKQQYGQVQSPFDEPHRQNARRRRNKRLLIGLVVAVVVLAIALGVGLGVGLKQRASSSRSASSSRFPGSTAPAGSAAPGQDDSTAGMQQSGFYFSSYVDENVQLNWTQQDLAFQSSGSSRSASRRSSAPGISIPLAGSSSGNGASNSSNSSSATPMDGFGAALTDSSASLLVSLNQTNPTEYAALMRFLFNRRTGLSILRVPIGATDFSPPGFQYTFADRESVSQTPASVTDTVELMSASFNDTGAQRYLYPVLKDALALNPDLKVYILPWSPPAWMKTGDSLAGGALLPGASELAAEYIAQSARAFQSALGVAPWALAVQNEPSHPAYYPSMAMDNDVEIHILEILRGRLAQLGMPDTKLFAHEDNFVGWQLAANMVNYNASMLDGVTWHCYNGSSSLVSNFAQATGTKAQGKRMVMSECSGQAGTDFPSGFKWWAGNIFFPLLARDFSAITVWNLALDSDYGPRLKTAYCDNCIGALTVNGQMALANVQSVLLAHFSAASADLSRLGGGPAVQLGADVPRDLADCISATAFAAPWNATSSSSSSSSTQHRYGLLVQNTCDDTSLPVQLGNSSGSTTLSFPSGLSTYVWTA